MDTQYFRVTHMSERKSLGNHFPSKRIQIQESHSSTSNRANENQMNQVFFSVSAFLYIDWYSFVISHFHILEHISILSPLQHTFVLSPPTHIYSLPLSSSTCVPIKNLPLSFFRFCPSNSSTKYGLLFGRR